MTVLSNVIASNVANATKLQAAEPLWVANDGGYPNNVLTKYGSAFYQNGSSISHVHQISTQDREITLELIDSYDGGNSGGMKFFLVYKAASNIDGIYLFHDGTSWRLRRFITYLITISDAAFNQGNIRRKCVMRSEGGNVTLSVYDGSDVLIGSQTVINALDVYAGAFPACVYDGVSYSVGDAVNQDGVGYMSIKVDDLSTTEPETVDCTIAAVMPAPVVSATAEILAPEAATVAAVMPAPVVSVTADILDPVAVIVAAALPAPVASVTAETLEPVECTVYAMLPAPLVTCTIEFDEPDEVQVVIAAALPAPLVGIVAEVLEPLEATVAAELPAPVASATADVLEPLTASVAAGLPAPVASATGETFEPLECTVAAMLPAPVVQVVAGAEVVPVPPIVAQYIADLRAALNPATGGPGESVSITPVGGTQFTVPLAMISRKGMIAPAELPREYAGRAGSWVVVRLLMDDLPDIPPTDSLIMVDGRGHFIRCIQPLGPQGCGVRLYAVGDQWGRR